MQNPLQIPVFVISLKEAHQRRQRMEKILGELSLDFTFIDAIDGRDFNMADHQNYDGQKRRRYFGRDLGGGELGCTLSHKKIFQMMLDQNIERALILEDDIIFYDNFMNALEDVLNTKTPYDMVRFFGALKVLKHKNYQICPLPKGGNLSRLCATPGGTYAYIMTKKGAEKLLPHMEKNVFPIDGLVGRSWQTGLNWLTVLPLTAYVDFDLGSDIGKKRFDKTLHISGFSKIFYPFNRAWFKLCETIGKRYWYYTHYFKDKKAR